MDGSRSRLKQDRVSHGVGSLLLVLIVTSFAIVVDSEPMAFGARGVEVAQAPPQSHAGISSQQQYSRGVSGMILTPPSEAYVNPIDSSNLYSDANIYIIDSNDFVQFGWYVGQSTGLPNAPSPRAFYGEKLGTGEKLRPGPTLSWNTYYLFRIDPAQEANGLYRFWLNNVLRTSTLYSHDPYMTASFNGETWECARMDARAYRNQASLSILQYELNDGTWHWFDDQFFYDGGFTSTTVGGAAHTDYASGRKSPKCSLKST